MTSEADTRSVYDCVIVGGGPAGLTCAIFLARYRRDVLVIDAGEPRNAASQGVHGFLGQHGIRPAELLAKGRAEAEEAGAEICNCRATKVERCGDHFEVTTSAGVFKARRVVLAYGIRDTFPNIPDFEAFNGRSIYHCPDCDGYEISDRRVGVIGTGKRVAGLTLRLSQWTDQLSVLTNGNEPDIDPEEMSKLQAESVTIIREKITKLVGSNGILRKVEFENHESIELDALYFTLGVTRSCDLAEVSGCEVYAETPNIVVNEYKETSVEGIYAIGDLVAGSQLVITSAADGAIAAIAINQSLLPPAKRVS